MGDTPPCCGCMISIHALLAESDLTFTFTLILLSVISIHALLAESDFLIISGQVPAFYFYPRSPCGERRLFYVI